MLIVTGPELRVVAPPGGAGRPARLYGVLTVVVGGLLGLYPLLLGLVTLTVPGLAALVGLDGEDGARIGLGVGLMVAGGLFTVVGAVFLRAWRLMAGRARASGPTLLLGCRPDGLLTPDGDLVPWAEVRSATVSWRHAVQGTPATVGGQLGRELGRAMTDAAGMDGIIRQLDLTLDRRPPLRAALGPYLDDREFRRVLDAVAAGMAPYGRAPR